MKGIFFSLLIVSLSFANLMAQNPDKITFKSLDSLDITADVYEIDKAAPVILLCHQARFSRGEYKETALKLNELGFNCVAIDQRSGGEINGVVNETAKLAKQKKLPVEYLDAKQDIMAAFTYCARRWKTEVILMGSSYSASLVLELGRQLDGVKGVIAFSPGEYFGEHPVYKNANGIAVPVFITCSQEEVQDTKVFFASLNAKTATYFVPIGAGEHGSKALWSDKADHEEYWTALAEFLASINH